MSGMALTSILLCFLLAASNPSLGVQRTPPDLLQPVRRGIERAFGEMIAVLLRDYLPESDFQTPSRRSAQPAGSAPLAASPVSPVSFPRPNERTIASLHDALRHAVKESVKLSVARSRSGSASGSGNENGKASPLECLVCNSLLKEVYDRLAEDGVHLWISVDCIICMDSVQYR